MIRQTIVLVYYPSKVDGTEMGFKPWQRQKKSKGKIVYDMLLFPRWKARGNVWVLLQDSRWVAGPRLHWLQLPSTEGLAGSELRLTVEFTRPALLLKLLHPTTGKPKRGKTLLLEAMIGTNQKIPRCRQRLITTANVV